MVDRIVPATTDADVAEVARQLGLADAVPVVFEPFRQWVIEDRFAAARPAWEDDGAELVADVAPFETMKLRLLNGSHSTLAYLGFLAGHVTIWQASSDPPLATLIERQMTEEIVPTLVAPPGTDLAAYCAQLMVRFRNPALPHRTQQIAMDGSQKLPQRLLGTVRDRIAAGAPVPPSRARRRRLDPLRERRRRSGATDRRLRSDGGDVCEHRHGRGQRSRADRRRLPRPRSRVRRRPRRARGVPRGRHAQRRLRCSGTASGDARHITSPVDPMARDTARPPSRPPVSRGAGDARARATPVCDGQGLADRQSSRAHRSAVVRRRRPVRERVGAVHHARSLRVPDALQPGRAARGPRHPAPRWRADRAGRTPDLAHVCCELSSLPRHADAHLARPRLCDGLRHRRATDARVRRPRVRSHQRLPAAAGVSTTRTLRAVQPGGAGDDGVAPRSARASREDSRVGVEGPRDHRLSPGSCRGSGVRRLPRQRRAARRDRPARTRRPGAAISPRIATAAPSSRSMGATSTDHGHPTARTCDLARVRMPAPARPCARGPRHAGRSGSLPRADADRDGADEPRRRPRDADPSGQLPQSQSCRSTAISGGTRAPTSRPRPITSAH